MENINKELEELFKQIKEDDFFIKLKENLLFSKPKNLDLDTELILKEEVKNQVDIFFKDFKLLLFEYNKKWNFWIETVEKSNKLSNTVNKLLDNINSRFNEKHNSKIEKSILKKESEIKELISKRDREIIELRKNSAYESVILKKSHSNTSVEKVETIIKAIIYVASIIWFGVLNPVFSNVIQNSASNTENILGSVFFVNMLALPFWFTSFTQSEKPFNFQGVSIKVFLVNLPLGIIAGVLSGGIGNIIAGTLILPAVSLIPFWMIMGMYSIPARITKFLFGGLGSDINQSEYEKIKVEIESLKQKYQKEIDILTSEVNKLKSQLIILTKDTLEEISRTIAVSLINAKFIISAQASINNALTTNTTQYIQDFNKLSLFEKKKRFLSNFYYNGINGAIAQLGFLRNDEKLNIKDFNLENESNSKNRFVIYTEPSITITTGKLNSIKENILIYLKRYANQKYTEFSKNNEIVTNSEKFSFYDVVTSVTGDMLLYYCDKDLNSMLLFDYQSNGYEPTSYPNFSPALEKTFLIPKGFFNNLKLDIEERNGQIAFVFTNSTSQTINIPESAINNTKEQIKETLEKNSVKGYEEDLPELISYRSIDAENDNIYTFGLTYNLPKGIGKKDISRVEDKINAVIAPAKIEEVNGDDAELEIIIRKGTRTKTSFTLADAKIDKTKLEIPIGFRVDGEYGDQIMIEMKEENNAHMMVVGATGSGKTNTVLYFLTNLLKRFSSDELRIAITVDKQDFVAFDKYPEYYYLPRPKNPMDRDETPKMIFELFRRLRDERGLREVEFAKYEATTIHEFNQAVEKKKDAKKMPFIYVIFEELGVNLAEMDLSENSEIKKEARNFGTSVASILKDSRRYGIYFIFISQVVGDMKNSIQQNVRYKIAHQITEKESLSLFEKPDAAKLGDKQGLIQIGTDNTNLVKFKSPLAKKDGILEELKKSMDKKSSS